METNSAIDVNGLLDEEVHLVRFLLPSLMDTTIVYAVNSQKVEAVIESDEVVKTPENLHPFVGIVYFRSMPVPILDVDYLLRKEGNYKTKSLSGSRILVCRVARRLIGILVAKTKPVLTIQSQNILAPPQEMCQKNGIEFIGIYRHLKETIMLLNIESIMEVVSPQDDRCLLPAKVLVDSSILKGKKILALEDSRFAREKLKRILAQTEANVMFAENGKEGYEILKNCEVPIDAIITDFEMPIMNGLQFARLVKESPKFEKIPIFFLTAVNGEAIVDFIKTNNLGEYYLKGDEASLIASLAKKLKPKHPGFEIFDD